ncbi:hypothetical protein AX16_001630 [Volvariella volvacea WC 439]|nr:hypothetical protein AX16_001630 [Volvariella volvacea WC 439]
MKPELLPSQFPLSTQHSPRSERRRKWLRFTDYITVALLVLFFGYHIYHGYFPQKGCGNELKQAPVMPSTPPTHQRAVCPQPSPAAKPSNYSALYNTPEFASLSANRLSGAVQIPTVTYDDMGAIGDPEWKPFEEFLTYLNDTFPLVHKTLDIEIISGYSPIYTWKGSNSDLKPLMLTAHIDVVPVDEGSIERWTYPPFSGEIDGEWVYGRGSADTKTTLIGIVSAVEHLIESNWEPTRTIILAFGQDEEISGPQGAANIAKHLESIYSKYGIAMLVDEGGLGLARLFGTDFALPGVGEKGFLNMHIQVDTQGGHSSVPPPHTSIGTLAKITSDIEISDVFKPHLELESPVWAFMNCLAQYGDHDQLPEWLIDSVNAEDPDLSAAAMEFAKISPATRYLIQTSKAPTVIRGGVKSNALAESANVTFNSRIELLSSVQEVRDAFLSIIRPIAEEYSFRLNGEVVSGADPIGNITVGSSNALEPSPISSTYFGAWALFSKAVQAAFGENVITAPNAMTANTDTRHYWNLTHNIYRWSPIYASTELNIHTVDEKIQIKSHVDGIKFFTGTAFGLPPLLDVPSDPRARFF